ncbi:MAG TPA: tRNA adenosine(34) deaminase TadA [Rhodothermales bacterium]|nr:tRNA adenosine(34) deaminase TadA [Rhodothermales bacterium]HRR09930.1 tRNA adenosine(34) deaminase TadA [Rhodothermales bacterium]
MLKSADMSLDSLLNTEKRWMKYALKEAERAAQAGEVPVGAVVVKEGVIIGRGHNQVEQLQDPTAHAEILAITAACETLGTKWLYGCTLYVTLEPCPMCSGALVMARLARLVFGAFDEKAGCCGTLHNLVQDKRFNHRMEVVSGVEADLSAKLLKTFFHQQRMRPENAQNN